jgi:hypothetical protein
MAKAEGWSTKNGSKWLTMPGQMLRYRAASFWSRAYASDLSLGFYTQDEVKDFAEPARNVTPISPIKAIEKPIEKEIEPESEVIEAEIVVPCANSVTVPDKEKVKPERKLTLQELIDNAED